MPRDEAYLLDMLLAAREAIAFAATVEDLDAVRVTDSSTTTRESTSNASGVQRSATSSA